MMESGLLSEKLAKEVYEKKQKKGLQNKFSSPVKSASAVKSNSRSVTVKKKTSSSTPVRSVNKKTDSTLKQSKKRKMKDDSDSDSDDEFILAKVKKRKVA